MTNYNDLAISIKNAKFEYDDLVSRAEILKVELETIYENSNLIEKPNLDKINKLLFIIRDRFYNQME